MDETAVDRFYGDGTALVRLAESSGDASATVFAQDLFRKALVLSIASYFERRVTEVVLAGISGDLPDRHPMRQFCENRGLVRQYHSLFDWESSNANRFFAFFGAAFKEVVSRRVRDTDGMADAVVAFLQLGQLRNRMVHGNFDSFMADDTADEIFDKFQRASRFLEEFSGWLQQYCERPG
jgi:hypothetical protein